MPITSRSAPRAASARLIAHVTDLLREKKTLPGARVELRLEKMSHSDPHPVYYVPLDALAEGKLLAAATQTSWRYLLVQDDAAIAEAELSAGGKGAGKAKGKRPARPLALLGVSQGPFTAATLDALHAAEQLPKVAAAEYELRLLKVPAVYLAALWLHSPTDDILIPMGNPPGGLRKNRAYSEKQILRALKPVVERTRQFHDAYEQKRKRPRSKKS